MFITEIDHSRNLFRNIYINKKKIQASYVQMPSYLSMTVMMMEDAFVSHFLSHFITTVTALITVRQNPGVR